MNNYKNNPRSKHMDIRDALIGFAFSFAFFSALFLIAFLVKILN